MVVVHPHSEDVVCLFDPLHTRIRAATVGVMLFVQPIARLAPVTIHLVHQRLRGRGGEAGVLVLVLGHDRGADVLKLDRAAQLLQPHPERIRHACALGPRDQTGNQRVW